MNKQTTAKVTENKKQNTHMQLLNLIETIEFEKFHEKMKMKIFFIKMKNKKKTNEIANRI